MAKHYEGANTAKVTSDDSNVLVLPIKRALQWERRAGRTRQDQSAMNTAPTTKHSAKSTESRRYYRTALTPTQTIELAMEFKAQQTQWTLCTAVSELDRPRFHGDGEAVRMRQ